jgi:hypothetical protein
MLITIKKEKRIMKMTIVCAVLALFSISILYAQKSIALRSIETSEESVGLDENFPNASEVTETDDGTDFYIESKLIEDLEVTKQFGFEYFPLNTDVSYLYDSNAGDTEAGVKPNGKELVLTYDAGKISYEQQFFKGEDGIYLTRTESSALIFFGATVTYPEPVLRLPLPLEVGKKWAWEGFEIADGDTGMLTISGEAMAEEVVTTPIGEFNCLKIRLKIESEHGSKNTVTEWLAPGIGVVKFHAALEGTGLTAFLQDIFGLDELTFDLTGFDVNRN